MITIQFTWQLVFAIAIICACILKKPVIDLTISNKANDDEDLKKEK